MGTPRCTNGPADPADHKRGGGHVGCVLHPPPAPRRARQTGPAKQRKRRATISFIETAVGLTRRGDTSAVVTCPISKDVLIGGAAFPHPGHTEYLAALDGAARPVMMLAGPQLRVVPVTIHIALSQIPGTLTASLLRETIEITHAGLIRDFGITSPPPCRRGAEPSCWRKRTDGG